MIINDMAFFISNPISALDPYQPEGLPWPLGRYGTRADMEYDMKMPYDNLYI